MMILSYRTLGVQLRNTRDSITIKLYDDVIYEIDKKVSLHNVPAELRMGNDLLYSLFCSVYPDMSDSLI